MRVWYLLLLLLLSGTASAGPYSINGTTYDTTWDGRVIPSYQIIYGSNDDVILVQELIPATAFTVGNDTIYINNNFTSFNRDKFKISPVMTFPKTLLASRMVNYNTTVAYLVFPYSLSRVKDYISENEIKMGNWTFRAGAEHIDIYDDNETQNILPKSAYTFKIVDDEIRLYFLKLEANKLLGNITFEMQSWTINGSTTPAWQNTSGDAVIRGNGYITNDLNIGGYTSWWDFKKGSGTSIYDINRTTANDGTINGTTWQDNGMYFDGINDSITLTKSAVINTNSVTFFAKLRRINNSDSNIIYAESSANSDVKNLMALNISGYPFYDNYLPSGNAALSTGAVSNNTVTDVIFVVHNSSNISFYIDKEYKNTRFRDIYSGISPYAYHIGRRINIVTPVQDDFFSGYLYDLRFYPIPLTTEQIIDIEKYNVSNNRTAWYDSGSGNEIYQIDVNATTPENTNYTVWYANNGTGSYSQLGSTLTGNNSLTISGTKYQNTDVQVRLAGNTTATPELIQITFFDQAASGLSCGLNTLTNVTVYANGSATTCNPTNGTTAITMNYTFQQYAADDTYTFNMTTATSSSRVFNESSNNGTMGIQLLHGGLDASSNYTIKIYNTTIQIFQFHETSNASGWIEYNTSVFNESRYTVITKETPSYLVYGVLAVVIISGAAYILRRVTKV